MTRAGNFPGCAYKRYLQSLLSFSNSIALKKDGEPVFVLRHECRFPPASASLIEKIGQRVFVFACMPRELDYDGLVFFHADGKIEIC